MGHKKYGEYSILEYFVVRDGQKAASINAASINAARNEVSGSQNAASINAASRNAASKNAAARNAASRNAAARNATSRIITISDVEFHNDGFVMFNDVNGEEKIAKCKSAIIKSFANLKTMIYAIMNKRVYYVTTDNAGVETMNVYGVFNYDDQMFYPWTNLEKCNEHNDNKCVVFGGAPRKKKALVRPKWVSVAGKRARSKTGETRALYASATHPRELRVRRMVADSKTGKKTATYVKWRGEVLVGGSAP